MITRRRYNVPVKKANLESGRQMDLRAGRRAARRGKQSQSASGEATSAAEFRHTAAHAPVRDVQEYWWTDWRSMAAVVGLVFAIGAGLYLVNGMGFGMGESSASAAAPAGSASASSNGTSGYAGAEGATRASPQVSDAQSFLAFSRSMKAAHAGRGSPVGSAVPATSAPSGTSPSSPSGSPSVLSHGDQNVVLPDKLSGDCAVGGANLTEFLKGLGACFSRRGGRDA